MEPGRRGRGVPKLESLFLNSFSFKKPRCCCCHLGLVCDTVVTRAGTVLLSPSLGSSWLCSKDGEIPELKTHRELTGTSCPEPLRDLPAWQGDRGGQCRCSRTGALGTSVASVSQGHLRVILGPPQASQGLRLWQLRVLLLLSAPGTGQGCVYD